MMGSMMRRAMLGDGSTLSLDFTQMSTLADLTSRGLTFSRSTSGTFINASGLVATATAGNPRFDYDTSGNPKGILIEGSATNLVYHSETFRLTAVAAEPYWADSASISRGSDTAPDGTAGAAVNFVAIGTAGTVIQTAAVGSSANRTFSFWAKRSGGGTVEYTLDNGSTWTAVTITASWVRYTATATNANQRVGFRVATGAGTSIWGAQLEAGSGSSSYIPSGASQGSRAADECQLLDLTTMGFNANAGTIYLDVGSRLNSSGRSYTFLPTSGVTDQIFEGGGYALNVYTSGAFVAQIGGSTVNAQKIAAAYAANDFASSTNGAAVATDTVGSLPTTLAKLTIGGSIANPAGYLSGRIRVLKYWPTRLPNAQLQALTT